MARKKKVEKSQQTEQQVKSDKKAIKVYISQTATNHTQQQLDEQNQKLSKAITDFVKKYHQMDCEILSTKVDAKDCADGAKLAVWFVGKQIEVLSQAHLVLFASDWQNGKDCKIERFLCQQFNIPTLDEQGLLALIEKNENEQVEKV